MPAVEQFAETFERELKRLADAPRYQGQIGEADIARLTRLFAEVISAEEKPADGESLYRGIAQNEA